MHGRCTFYMLDNSRSQLAPECVDDLLVIRIGFSNDKTN